MVNDTYVKLYHANFNSRRSKTTSFAENKKLSMDKHKSLKRPNKKTHTYFWTVYYTFIT